MKTQHSSSATSSSSRVSVVAHASTAAVTAPESPRPQSCPASSSFEVDVDELALSRNSNHSNHESTTSGRTGPTSIQKERATTSPLRQKERPAGSLSSRGTTARLTLHPRASSTTFPSALLPAAPPPPPPTVTAPPLPAPPPPSLGLPIVSSVLVEESEDQQQQGIQLQRLQHRTAVAPTPSPAHLLVNNPNPSTVTDSSDELIDAPVTVVNPNSTQLGDASNHSHRQDDEEKPKAVGVAQEAGLTDILENRNTQRTLGWLLCVALALVVFVLVFVFVFTGKDDTEDPSEVPTGLPTVSPVPSVSPSSSPPVTSSPTTAPQLPTEEPTAAPLVLELPEDTIAALQNVNSPQSKAYAWLKEHPDLDGMPEWEKQQYMAVLSIYYASNGEESWWTMQMAPEKGNFKSYDVPLCKWTPFQSQQSSTNNPQNENSQIGLCTDQGQLTSLTLHHIQGNNIFPWKQQGFLPAEVSFLSRLSSFHMNNCNLGDFNLTAFLPPELTSLPELGRLQFYSNRLMGSIPHPSLSSLSKLTHLSLDDNALTGHIPTEVGLLTSLQYFTMVFNVNIRGSIPSQIGQLNATLQTLRLYNTRITGTVPSQIAQLTKLKVLQLDRNTQLKGTLPADLCTTLPSLKNIRLNDRIPCPTSCTNWCI